MTLSISFSIQSPLLHTKKEIADYAISFSMTRTGFEPVLPPWKGGVLPTWPTGQLLAEKKGFEPSHRVRDLLP